MEALLQWLRDPLVINSVGLGLDIVGVLLLFLFGMPELSALYGALQVGALPAPNRLLRSAPIQCHAARLALAALVVIRFGGGSGIDWEGACDRPTHGAAHNGNTETRLAQFGTLPRLKTV